MDAAPALLTVTEAHGLLRRRELSSRELTEACLERIAEHDGPWSHEGAPDRINAFASVDAERALEDAVRADGRLAREEEPAPLLGIPLAVKEAFAIPGRPQSASSRVLREPEVARAPAPAWAALARAGMVTLGRTRMWEFGFGTPPEAVGNPWDPRRSPAGSSSGSAAALAARFAPAALGSDTGGSLRAPAAWCGVSALKPTLGMLSIARVVPCARSYDHVGPMARTLTDCALLLAALVRGAPGPRPLEPPTADGLAPRGGTRPLAGVRFVLSPRTSAPETGATTEVLAATARLVQLMIELGATFLDMTPPPFDQRGFWSLIRADALTWHREAGHWPARRDDYTPRFRALLEAGEAEALDPGGYAACALARRTTASTWSRWLARQRIDVVLEPTMPSTAAPRLVGAPEADGAPPGANLTSFWNHVGLPVVALPAGLGVDSGLPVGISLAGAPASDLALLQIGIDLQERLGVPEPPPLGTAPGREPINR